MQALGFFGQAALRSGALQQHFQRAGLDGLFQEPERTQIVHGLNGGFDVSKRRQYDGGRQAALRASRFNSSKPSMRGIIRSVTRTWTGVCVKFFESLLAVGRGLDGESPGLDHLRQTGSLILFVVRDEHATCRGHISLTNCIRPTPALYRNAAMASSRAVVSEIPSETAKDRRMELHP